MNFPLVLILVLAALLRLCNLASLSLSLFGDELDVGYHALSLFKTGADYTGHFLPTYIQSLAEWRTPLLMYVTAPFVGLMGPSSFSVRLPVALLGLINIYLIYRLSNRLFPHPKKLIGLLAALTLAITPWHIHYSRIAFESTLLLTLLLVGFHLFLSYTHSQRFPYLLFPIPLALSLYTYSTAALFVPLLFVALLFIYRKRLKLKNLFLHLLFFFPLLIPYFLSLLSGEASNRFSGISIFSDPNLIDQVVTTRTEVWVTPSFWETLFHNKVQIYLVTFLRQYLTTFSPQFLFLYSDTFARHSVTGFGALPWVTLPFLLLGLIYTLNNYKKPSSQFLLSWLLLSPIPSALTQNGAAHATRLFILLPPLVIFAGIGLDLFFSSLKKSYRLITLITFVILVFLNLAFYWHSYSAHYAARNAKLYNYGYEDIFKKLIPLQEKANNIYINNSYQPSIISYAFYTSLSPKLMQQNYSKLAHESGDQFFGYQLLDNLYFGKIKVEIDLAKFLAPNDIYLAVQGIEVPGDWDWSKTPPEGLKILAVTHDVFGSPLFYLVTPTSSNF